MSRPNMTEWAFGVAVAISTRGECTRRQVGAVIIDRNGRIAGAGYNGTHRGGLSCLEGACPRGRHYPVRPGSLCRCGADWPCPEAVQPGSQYDTGPGSCIAVHAELNALLDVSDKGRLESSELYVTAPPCDGCLKIIRNTQVYRVNWLDDQLGHHTAVWPFVIRMER